MLKFWFIPTLPICIDDVQFFFREQINAPFVVVIHEFPSCKSDIRLWLVMSVLPTTTNCTLLTEIERERERERHG